MVEVQTDVAAYPASYLLVSGYGGRGVKLNSSASSVEVKYDWSCSVAALFALGLTLRQLGCIARKRGWEDRLPLPCESQNSKAILSSLTFMAMGTTSG